jgi:hypothetical protein
VTDPEEEHVHYMLFMCDDGASDDGAWRDRLGEQGLAHRGWRLGPVEQAVTVRIRDGRTLVTEGPADGSYAPVTAVGIVDCPDLDVAIEAAGGHPAAGRSAVEIRPFWED